MFFGVVLELASFTATVFPCPGAVVLCGLSSPKNCVLERAQKASKSSFSMGFRSYVRHFFGAFFAPSPSFRALLFGCGGGAVSELGKLEDGYFSCNFRKQR